MLNFQSFNARASCHNVSNGIEGANFMKRDVLRRNVVDLPFCQRDAVEYSDASDFDEIAELAVLDQTMDLSKAASMCVLAVNISRVIMGVNLEFPAGDALADSAVKMGVNHAAKVQRGNGGIKDAFLDAKVPESTDRHVTADA